MIHTTVYVSTLVEPLGSGEVAVLLEASQVANARTGVTGLSHLVFGEGQPTGL